MPFSRILSISLLSSFGFFYSSAQDLLYLDGSGAAANLTIQSGVDVYVEGGYVANSGAAGMQLDGNLYIGKTSGSISANWTDNMASSSVLNTSTGTVYLQSNLEQDIDGASTKFYNLYLNNSSANTSGIQLMSNIEVRNQITFNDGLVYANNNALYVSNSSSNAIVNGPGNTPIYSNSWVSAIYSNGKLDREITSGGMYDFPVGSSSASQLLQAETSSGFNGISRFSSSWEASIQGGVSPLLLSECGTPYSQLSPSGEWHLRPANGGTYGTGSVANGNLTLTGWNLSTFTGLIDNQFAVLTRAEGNNSLSGWAVPVPNCSSLAPFNAAGRIISSDRVIRNNITVFDDATSQLGIGVTIVVLPIELTEFNVTPLGDDAVLTWNTSSEYNSDFFAVERSLDGVAFEQIGIVNAAGASILPSDYSFIDYGVNEFPVNKVYYRLRMVDVDQSFEYSAVRWINVSGNPGSNFTIVYPNPFSDNVSLSWNSSSQGSANVQLVDVSGRIVSQQNVDFVTGNNFVLLDQFASLSQGVYFLRLSAGKTQLTQKLVKE